MASTLSLEELYEKYYDQRAHYEMYFTKDSSFKDDARMFAMKHLHRVFESGAITGDTLITVGHSFLVHTFISPAAFFKEIIVADDVHCGTVELQKWLNNEPDAMDYDKALKDVCELEGDRERWSEKKELLQGRIQQVVKCDIMKSNPLFPVSVPQADCLITTAYLEAHCLDMNSYRTAMRNISSLLKIGGHLVMTAALGCTFLMVGTMKFPFLCLDEGGLREAASNAGFVIETLEVFPRTTQCKFDIIDFTHLAFIVACKQSAFCE